jgi:hypothetical protein
MTSLPVSDHGAAPRRAILGQLPKMYRADGSPIRVLLVGDERALTNLVRMALQYEGWEIGQIHQPLATERLLGRAVQRGVHAAFDGQLKRIVMSNFSWSVSWPGHRPAGGSRIARSGRPALRATAECA